MAYTKTVTLTVARSETQSIAEGGSTLIRLQDTGWGDGGDQAEQYYIYE